MEYTAEKLAKYCLNFSYNDVTPEVLAKAKRLLLDTLGCALGAYNAEPARYTRNVLTEWGGKSESTVFGKGIKIPCANAAMINGIMVRYLDFNDSKAGSGHPSEIIPTILAIGERENITGQELITDIVLGYEIAIRLSKMFHPVGDMIDNTTVASFCVPFITGRMLGLNVDQIVNAVGVSGSHNLGVNKVFRSGDRLTMIKGMGYAFGAQSAITATFLAKEGVTGPDNMIEVLNEINNQTQENLEGMIAEDGGLKILQVGLKPYASEFMSHSPLQALLTITREHSIKPEDVEEIQVYTYDRATRLARPVTYTPETREKADHSLPYCMAVALTEGDLWPEQFEHEQWKDPKIIALMQKIKCQEDPEMSKLYPKLLPARVEIRTSDGKTYSASVEVNKGNPKNPMTDEEVESKFRRLAAKVMSEEQADEIIRTVNNIENSDNINDLINLMIFDR